MERIKNPLFPTLVTFIVFQVCVCSGNSYEVPVPVTYAEGYSNYVGRKHTSAPPPVNNKNKPEHEVVETQSVPEESENERRNRHYHPQQQQKTQPPTMMIDQVPEASGYPNFIHPMTWNNEIVPPSGFAHNNNYYAPPGGMQMQLANANGNNGLNANYQQEPQQEEENQEENENEEIQQQKNFVLQRLRRRKKLRRFMIQGAPEEGSVPPHQRSNPPQAQPDPAPVYRNTQILPDPTPQPPSPPPLSAPHIIPQESVPVPSRQIPYPRRSKASWTRQHWHGQDSTADENEVHPVHLQTHQGPLNHLYYQNSVDPHPRQAVAVVAQSGGRNIKMQNPNYYPQVLMSRRPQPQPQSPQSHPSYLKSQLQSMNDYMHPAMTSSSVARIGQAGYSTLRSMRMQSRATYSDDERERDRELYFGSNREHSPPSDDAYHQEHGQYYEEEPRKRPSKKSKEIEEGENKKKDSKKKKDSLPLRAYKKTKDIIVSTTKAVIGAPKFIYTRYKAAYQKLGTKRNSKGHEKYESKKTKDDKEYYYDYDDGPGGPPGGSYSGYGGYHGPSGRSYHYPHDDEMYDRRSGPYASSGRSMAARRIMKRYQRYGQTPRGERDERMLSLPSTTKENKNKSSSSSWGIFG